MANPQVPQGVLNRLRGSLVIPAFPQLNVTAAYLAKEGISIAFEGDAAVMLPTMTGAARSPAPYQMVTITVAVLKTQNLSDLYKQQVEIDTSLGAVSVFGDASTLGVYDFQNCVVQGVKDLRFDGTEPAFSLTIQGIYQVNSSLYDAA